MQIDWFDNLITSYHNSESLLFYIIAFRQVVEKLRLGEQIVPESFDSVSIFFSDIVSFTEFSSKCTPMQVVNFLNDIYTIFDSTIDERDVYKVETVGDAYLCVSGLPRRNGSEHIKEICLMSLSLLKDLRDFRVSHMPSYRVMIRIGVHTGNAYEPILFRA
ncbi:unnamed protein product [Strongylus vulgaris]|uniref:Guanylate cyclase domain-containing protein n=1 Tax=Strongylus vulgaris TaxID=40348 RepID=A0A3P7IE16_STRVU|nr:unnamed protein product [Strongylus vulgaris]